MNVLAQEKWGQDGTWRVGSLCAYSFSLNQRLPGVLTAPWACQEPAELRILFPLEVWSIVNGRQGSR